MNLFKKLTLSLSHTESEVKLVPNNLWLVPNCLYWLTFSRSFTTRWGDLIREECALRILGQEGRNSIIEWDPPSQPPTPLDLHICMYVCIYQCTNTDVSCIFTYICTHTDIFDMSACLYISVLHTRLAQRGRKEQWVWSTHPPSQPPSLLLI